MAVSFLGGGTRSTRRKPPTCRKSLTNFITYMLYRVHLTWVGFGLKTLVVIGTDCIGSLNPTTIRSRPRRLLLSLYLRVSKKLMISVMFKRVTEQLFFNVKCRGWYFRLCHGKTRLSSDEVVMMPVCTRAIKFSWIFVYIGHLTETKVAR